MVKRLKVLGLLIVAAFMLSAVASSVASAAMELPEFTVETEGKSTSKEQSKLRLEGTEISCRKAPATFKMTSKKLGTYTIDVNECTVFGEECHSLGDKEGLILTGGEWHLVLDTLGTTNHWLIWFLLTPVHTECKFLTTLLELKRNYLCKIIPIGTTETEFEINCDVVNGKQEFREYENDAGEKVTKEIGLLTSVSEGTFKETTVESLKNILVTVNKTKTKIVH